MKRLYPFLVFFCFNAFFVSAQIPAGYYDSAEGLVSDDLKSALNDIIDFHIEYPYSSSSTDTWDILKETDQDPNNTNNVLGIYSDFSMNAANEYNGGNGWNREHVWAKSRGDFGTSEGAGTDVHHLRAADISTNSARSNRNFDEAPTQYNDTGGAFTGLTNSYTGGNSIFTWEPPLDKKGDIARMIFYMATRYEGERAKDPDLELTETLLTQTDKSPLHGKLSVLLQWHEDDPVSTLERDRNDIIYGYQGNRNPFIDRPEFVDRIWGSQTILPLDLLAFTGAWEGDHVRLDWTTANAENVSHFEIEASTDGVQFEQIGQLTFLGDSDYYFYQQFVRTDTYYRLKTVDFNGYSEYSDIVYLTVPSLDTEVFTVANNSLHILKPAVGNTNITLLSSGGSVVEEMSFSGKKKVIDISSLSAGVYFVVVHDGSQKEVFPVTKR